MSRVSNRQILTALEGLPAAIAAAVSPSQTPAAEQERCISGGERVDLTVGETTVADIDGGYLQHVSAKLQARANDTGKTFVLYARVNKAQETKLAYQETKLAYCEADKWSSLTDKRIVGAVSTVAPE
jgi:hypothetical protein